MPERRYVPKAMFEDAAFMASMFEAHADGTYTDRHSGVTYREIAREMFGDWVLWESVDSSVLGFGSTVGER